MHAGADTRQGQAVGSLISDVSTESAVHWVTATSAPCVSIYRPVFIDTDVPATCGVPSDRYDSNTLWWRHERLHRAALKRDFPIFLEEIAAERDALEADFDRDVAAVQSGGTALLRTQVVEDCWRRAETLETRWLQILQRLRVVDAPAYRVSWSTLSQRAGLNDPR